MEQRSADQICIQYSLHQIVSITRFNIIFTVTYHTLDMTTITVQQVQPLITLPSTYQAGSGQRNQLKTVISPSGNYVAFLGWISDQSLTSLSSNNTSNSNSTFIQRIATYPSVRILSLTQDSFSSNGNKRTPKTKGVPLQFSSSLPYAVHGVFPMGQVRQTKIVLALQSNITEVNLNNGTIQQKMPLSNNTLFSQFLGTPDGRNIVYANSSTLSLLSLSNYSILANSSIEDSTQCKPTYFAFDLSFPGVGNSSSSDSSSPFSLLSVSTSCMVCRWEYSSGGFKMVKNAACPGRGIVQIHVEGGRAWIGSRMSSTLYSIDTALASPSFMTVSQESDPYTNYLFNTLPINSDLVLCFSQNNDYGTLHDLRNNTSGVKIVFGGMLMSMAKQKDGKILVSGVNKKNMSEYQINQYQLKYNCSSIQSATYPPIINHSSANGTNSNGTNSNSTVVINSSSTRHDPFSSTCLCVNPTDTFSPLSLSCSQLTCSTGAPIPLLPHACLCNDTASFNNYTLQCELDCSKMPHAYAAVSFGNPKRCPCSDGYFWSYQFGNCSQIQTTPITPIPIPTPTPPTPISTDNSSGGLSGGAIAVIVVCVIAFLVFLIVLYIFCWKKRGQAQNEVQSQPQRNDLPLQSRESDRPLNIVKRGNSQTKDNEQNGVKQPFDVVNELLSDGPDNKYQKDNAARRAKQDQPLGEDHLVNFSIDDQEQGEGNHQVVASDNYLHQMKK